MKTAMIVEIKINYEKCIGCKKCVEACSFGVLEKKKKKPIVVNLNNCGVAENVRKIVQ